MFLCHSRYLLRRSAQHTVDCRSRYRLSFDVAYSSHRIFLRTWQWCLYVARTWSTSHRQCLVDGHYWIGLCFADRHCDCRCRAVVSASPFIGAWQHPYQSSFHRAIYGYHIAWRSFSDSLIHTQQPVAHAGQCPLCNVGHYQRSLAQCGSRPHLDIRLWSSAAWRCYCHRHRTDS